MIRGDCQSTCSRGKKVEVPESVDCDEGVGIDEDREDTDDCEGGEEDDGDRRDGSLHQGAVGRIS